MLSLFQKPFLLMTVSKSLIIYHWQVCDKMSLINSKLFVIKQELFFFVIYKKSFCYCNVGMQECFVIYYGK